MQIHSAVRTTLVAALFAAGALSAHAADSLYYNPANSASNTGKTLGYELFKTIGCPGRGMLETPCKEVEAAPAPVVAKPADSDGDGVTDDLDRCPGSLAGAKVDAQGCEADGDMDGVVDRLDNCPTTPPGRKVNALGCEMDGDGDGVVDALDNCPTTPAGRKVNAQGCEPDGDADGVPDALDNCPTTPPGRKVNALGCELDTDGDGVVDALDQCPATPAGRVVNAQGCELDGDKDGVVDALDKCPTTPAGVKVDAKGCEPDTDGDGVIDTLDQCPATPAGDRVDAKGCSLPNVMVLKGVTFDTSKATLQKTSISVLDEAVATLIRYPGLNVEVAGHTDNVGGAAGNLALSARRAKTVMDYFVSHGVPAERLSSKGYGETEPVADNAKAAGRAQNRRVELRTQK